MKILIIPNNTENACYHLRNYLPGKYLKQKGHEVVVSNSFEGYYHPTFGKSINPEKFDWADVVVFSRHYDMDPATIRNIILYCKANGKKVVYETDDLLSAVDPNNPAHQAVSRNAKQVTVMTTLANLCTTTGERLKNELLKLNNNVVICPNSIETDQWKLRKGKNKKVRVGWAGGSSHSADLLLITEAIRDLQKKIDFEFLIFGLVPKPWGETIQNIKTRNKQQIEQYYAKNAREPLSAPWFVKMIELDTALKEIKWEHHPFVPMDQYSQKLTDLNLDIGLCPLEDTRFNRCKSCIKFYEYAMVGTMTLASKVTPYQEEVSCCVKNRYDKWKNKLKNLITNKQERELIAQQQREWVLKNRDIRSNIHLWERAYNN